MKTKRQKKERRRSMDPGNEHLLVASKNECSSHNSDVQCLFNGNYCYYYSQRNKNVKKRIFCSRICNKIICTNSARFFHIWNALSVTVLCSTATIFC